jgi:hypothetical protein
MYYVGIDNGVSGSIGILDPEFSIQDRFFLTPVIEQYNYTKAKKKIHRIDVVGLRHILDPLKGDIARLMLERPMVNPGRFQATASALRALEATLIILEELQIPYEYIDSKGWQKLLLPQGIKGDELKKASVDVGIRLFPKFMETITKHKDADGLLIAEYCRRVR